jgi:hypothetical protein
MAVRLQDILAGAGPSPTQPSFPRAAFGGIFEQSPAAWLTPRPASITRRLIPYPSIGVPRSLSLTRWGRLSRDEVITLAFHTPACVQRFAEGGDTVLPL